MHFPFSYSGQNMMTSSNGNIFHVTGFLCGEFTGTGEFPAQRPVTRSFDVFFDLRLNQRMSKQSWGWWFETLSCPLWRHCYDTPWDPSSYQWGWCPDSLYRHQQPWQSFRSVREYLYPDRKDFKYWCHFNGMKYIFIVLAKQFEA